MRRGNIRWQPYSWPAPSSSKTPVRFAVAQADPRRFRKSRLQLILSCTHLLIPWWRFYQVATNHRILRSATFVWNLHSAPFEMFTFLFSVLVRTLIPQTPEQNESHSADTTGKTPVRFSTVLLVSYSFPFQRPNQCSFL